MQADGHVLTTISAKWFGQTAVHTLFTAQSERLFHSCIFTPMMGYHMHKYQPPPPPSFFSIFFQLPAIFSGLLRILRTLTRFRFRPRTAISWQRHNNDINNHPVTARFVSSQRPREDEWATNSVHSLMSGQLSIGQSVVSHQHSYKSDLLCYHTMSCN